MDREQAGGKKNCDTCGQPRDYKGRCIPYKEGNCNRYSEWMPKQADGDLISRAWIKEAIHNFYTGLVHTPTEEDIQAYLDVAPTVSIPSAEPKTGHWIKKDGYSDCSECSSHIVTEWDYCPKCGAKMESDGG